MKQSTLASKCTGLTTHLVSLDTETKHNRPNPNRTPFHQQHERNPCPRLGFEVRTGTATAKTIEDRKQFWSVLTRSHFFSREEPSVVSYSFRSLSARSKNTRSGWKIHSISLHQQSIGEICKKFHERNWLSICCSSICLPPVSVIF